MSMKRIYLLAAEAPEHITSKIDKLRSTVFRKTGTVSALAFDPLIPVAFYTGPLLQETFSEIRAPADKFKILEAEVSKCCIFLRVSNSLFFQELSGVPLEVKEAIPLFELFPGFFISECTLKEKQSLILNIIKQQKETLSITWSGLKIQLIEITYDNSQLWFNALDWRIIWEISLKTPSALS